MTICENRAGRKAWIGLAVLALPTLLVSIDVFVMLLALPRLSEALHATSTQQLWALDIFGFTQSFFPGVAQKKPPNIHFPEPAHERLI